MVRVLLDKGADPNYVLNSKDRHGDSRTGTIWEDTLARIINEFSRQSLTPESRAVWGKIARLMINHGAAVNRKVVESALNEGLLIFNRLLNTELDGIKELFYQALKRMKKDNIATLEL